MIFFFKSHGLQTNVTKVLQEVDTTRSLINRLQKEQAIYFGHGMRREKLEYLATTGMIQRKQPPKMLDGLTKSLNV